MKIRNLILSAALLTWASAASAQTMTEITGRQWMASDKDVREIFVLGYVNGLEQLLSHYNFQIRSGVGKYFDAHVLDEALYKKLLNEPELKNGPVRGILMSVLNDYAVLTDRVGNNLPSWQKLMSTSECAELMKTLYENQKSRMGF
jgi:hypothetical protein